MKAFQMDALRSEVQARQAPWFEFLRADSFSMGVYRLVEGESDRQSPHSEDEVYYVLSGRGRFRAGTEEYRATAGDIFYVGRLVEHRFFDIEQELTVLVFFAPAEGSAALSVGKP